MNEKVQKTLNFYLIIAANRSCCAAVSPYKYSYLSF